MQSTPPPAKFPIPFANAGSYNVIPTDSQVGVTPGAASLSDGFPPLTMTPLASGGIAPDGPDMNGILRRITNNLLFIGAGTPATFDGDYAGAIGGYPLGAELSSRSTPGLRFISLVENNADDPDAGGPNWRPSFVNTLQGFGGGPGYCRIGPLYVQSFASPPILIPGAGSTKSYPFNFPMPFPTACAWIGGSDGGGIGYTFGAFSGLTRGGGTGYAWSTTTAASTQTAIGHLLAVGY